jgi:two-component system NtrC family sensor kinase
VFNEAQKLIGAVHIAKDITEIKRTNRELKETYEQLLSTQAQLIQSEKMASLGILAAGVAHEINNPTAFVLGNLSTLKEYEHNLSEFISGCGALCNSTETKSQMEELKERFQIGVIMKDIPDLTLQSIEGAERIKKIVQDLKSFAHPGEGGMEKGDINQCLDLALSIAWNELKYKAEVVKEYGSLPEVSFNSQQMAQVFINLFVNAGQAMEARGKITIKTYIEEKFLYIEIADTGKGISQEHLAKIFDPFFTTKPVGQGTGLGLSIVLRIIKEHHGEIDVESVPGKGTTFVIKLPA